LFYRIGYYSLQFHRKLWNTALAVAFLLTAIAGVFIALQINYKWDIPFIKTVLKWHVEFGIMMAVTGLFHFSWHINYYGKHFEKPISSLETEEPYSRKPSEIKTDLFVTGFVSSSIQFLLMREMMNINGGYELTIGSFLASWLIGSSIGATIAGKSLLNDPKKIILIFSLSPLVSIFLMLFLSRMYLSPGETPSFLASVIYTFIVLIPFCLVSGFTFIKLLTIAGLKNNLEPGKSFAIETTGGIISGILVTLLTSGISGSYKLLVLIVLLSVGYALSACYISSLKTRIALFLSLSILAVFILIINPDLIFRQILLPGLKVTATKDTPYGNITWGKYKGQENLYYNQRLLSYSNDVTEREEDIHYAMLQSERPEKVIMISGSLRSHLPEILKYPVTNITYIERDPELTKIETDVSSSFTGKVVIVNEDAYRYIRKSQETVDVIILLLPPPSTLQLNRYYTFEFFNEVKNKLKPDGVFICSPGPGDSYFNKESLNLYSSIFNSLATVFKDVKPVVGNKIYFIASESPVSLSICQLVEKRQIKNTYVSSDFLDDDNIARKSTELSSLLDRRMKLNRSAFPVACFHSQSYQLSKTVNEKIPVLVLLFMVFAVPVIKIKRRNLLMYFSASALAGFEIILLLTLQLLIGNIYQMTGLIIAGLMAGLATGSGINSNFLNTISLRNKVILLLILYMIFGLIYNYLSEFRSGFAAVTFIMISGFLPAMLTGRIFRELTLKSDGVESSPIYSADLAGSAIGFIIISGFAVPVLGIQVSVFLLSALIFAGILFGTVRK
jgi:spermidine synthase